MARELIKEIRQIGDFLKVQKDILPEPTWKEMSANHVAAIQSRIATAASLTAEEATEMVETVRLSHFLDAAKAKFCESISQRLTELQASPRKPKRDTQVCDHVHRFLSEGDRRVLADASASQTAKLSQVVSRCAHIGLLWPAENTVGKIICTAIAAGIDSVDSEPAFLNMVQDFKRMIRKKRDKLVLPQHLVVYPDDVSSLPPVFRVSYEGDPPSPVPLAEVMSAASLQTLRMMYRYGLNVWGF